MVLETPGKKKTRGKKGKKGDKNKKIAVDVVIAKKPKQKKIAPAVAANGNTSITNEKTETSNDGKIAGFIFMCNARTKPECYQYRVFGLPLGNKVVVESIKEGMKLFLFDIELKLLYGVYKASSSGGVSLEPSAFNGQYPAQVRFKIHKDCIPVHESTFRDAIIENYKGGRKFRSELNAQQVKKLIKLFRAVPNGQSSQTFPAPAGAAAGRLLQPVAPVGPPPQPVMESRYLASMGLQPPVMEPRYLSSMGLPPSLMETRRLPPVAPPPQTQDPYYHLGSRRSYLSEQVSAYGKYSAASEIPSYGMPELPSRQDRVQDIYNARVNARSQLEPPLTSGYLKPGYLEPRDYTRSVPSRSNAANMPVSSYYSFSGGMR